MSTATRPIQAPYDFNHATLPTEETSNARNMGGERETVNRLQLVVFDAADRKNRRENHPTLADPGDGMTVCVDARFYMGRSSSASTVYCSVWIHTRDGRHFAGHGSAGGYGYHKESAALDDALESAGVKLTGRIDGCGEGPMRVALLAIGKAAGYGRCPQTIV